MLGKFDVMDEVDSFTLGMVFIFIKLLSEMIYFTTVWLKALGLSIVS